MSLKPDVRFLSFYDMVIDEGILLLMVVMHQTCVCLHPHGWLLIDETTAGEPLGEMFT